MARDYPSSRSLVWPARLSRTDGTRGVELGDHPLNLAELYGLRTGRAPDSDNSSMACAELACINHSPHKTFTIEAKGRALTSNIPPIRIACFFIRRRITSGLSLWSRLGSNRGLCTGPSRSSGTFIYHHLLLLPLVSILTQEWRALIEIDRRDLGRAGRFPDGLVPSRIG